MKLVIIKPKSTTSTTTSHFFMVAAVLVVVATALLLGTVVMMIGINQQAEAAIAINEKGVKIDVGEDDDGTELEVAISEKAVNIDVSEDGDAKLDVNVEEGKVPCRTCLAGEGDPVPGLDVKLGKPRPG
jgi:hypothetical protein